MTMLTHVYHSYRKLDCECQQQIVNKTVHVKASHQNGVKSIGDPLGDDDGADHHLGLQLPLL